MHVSHLSRRSFIEAAALAAGGGETISIVLGTRPELYRRALHTISRWDGDIETLAAAEVPVYMAIGENDDYYGSDPRARRTRRFAPPIELAGFPRSASASWSCSMSSPRATSPSGALLRTRASTGRAATSLPVTRTSWNGCSHDAASKGRSAKNAEPRGRRGACDPASGSDVLPTATRGFPCTSGCPAHAGSRPQRPSDHTLGERKGAVGLRLHGPTAAELGYASRDYASFFESALASCVLSTMPP